MYRKLVMDVMSPKQVLVVNEVSVCAVVLSERLGGGAGMGRG